MLHPVGTLSSGVYWKRRLVGVGLLLLLAVVPFLLLSGRNESQASGEAAVPAAAVPAATPQLMLVPAQPLQITTPAPVTTATATTASPPTTGPSTAAPSTTAPAGTVPSTTPAAAAPAACADAVVTVTAGSEQPDWSIGDEPVLLMSVQNTGDLPCDRDLGPSQQEWLLFDGGSRVWGSNDCQREQGADVRTLQPGQRVGFQVQWSGLTSDPGCDAPRNRLTPGDYELRARMGSAQSAEFTLTLS